jgi:hypothetical protein
MLARKNVLSLNRLSIALLVVLATSGCIRNYPARFSLFQKPVVHRSTTDATIPPILNDSILVLLSGGFGNHLSKVAHGLALQQELRKHLKQEPSLVLVPHFTNKHDSFVLRSKGLQAVNDIQQCFVSSILDGLLFRKSVLKGEGNIEAIQSTLETIEQYKREINHGSPSLRLVAHGDHELLWNPSFPRHSLSKAAVVADRLVTWDGFVDAWFKHIIEQLVGSHSSPVALPCCQSPYQLLPEADETVLVRSTGLSNSP